MNTQNVYDLSYADLETLLASWDMSCVHVREIWRGLYRQYATDFAQMENIPQAIRTRLTAEIMLALPELVGYQESSDGAARKDLLQLTDGEQIEVVLLRYRQRNSACISTQVGCACGCTFCATGQMGFVRQLSSGEIVGQVLHIQRVQVWIPPISPIDQP